MEIKFELSLLIQRPIQSRKDDVLWDEVAVLPSSSFFSDRTSIALSYRLTVSSRLNVCWTELSAIYSDWPVGSKLWHLRRSWAVWNWNSTEASRFIRPTYIPRSYVYLFSFVQILISTGESCHIKEQIWSRYANVFRLSHETIRNSTVFNHPLLCYKAKEDWRRPGIIIG